jgi:hypothetical protein
MLTRAILAGTVLLAGAAAPAQESRSAAVAGELARVLQAAKLEAIAAQDPSSPNRFVAALYFPEVQLLVVSAEYSAPSLLVDRIRRKEYREVYIDLNSASIPESKIFVMDQAPTGLAPRPDGDDEPFDIWEGPTRKIAFDGDWRAAKMSQAEYMKAFAETDEQYVRMLQVLLAQARLGS